MQMKPFIYSVVELDTNENNTEKNKGRHWLGNGLKQTFEDENGRWFSGQLLLTRKSTNKSIAKHERGLYSRFTENNLNCQ